MCAVTSFRGNPDSVMNHILHKKIIRSGFKKNYEPFELYNFRDKFLTFYFREFVFCIIVSVIAYFALNSLR